MSARLAWIYSVFALLLAYGFYWLYTQPLDPSQPAGFPARFGPHLVSIDGGQPQPFDASSLKNVKYWAFYYSASWCPPCRAFTPRLVDFYNQFKPQHPNFELIFVSRDRDEDSMLAYMNTEAMPWPAVRFGDIATADANEFGSSGIPDLVLVDADGTVLSDSFAMWGWAYVGPDKVIKDIETMVPTP